MKMKHILLGSILYVLGTGLSSLLFAQGSWQQVRKADWEFGLNKVYFLNDKKGFILGIHDELLVTINGAKSWNRFTFPDSITQKMNFFFNNICFIDSSLGWIVGGNGILTTTDGGKSWSINNYGIDDISLRNGHFCDRNHGTIAGSFGVIIHTKDGGKTWTQQDSGTDVFLITVFFVDSLKGWCAGRQGMILHTDDGGENWNRQDNHHETTITDLIFLDEHRGWAVGNGSAVLRTVDGGVTWQKVNIETDQEYLLEDIFFLNGQQGWIVGGEGASSGSSIILHTTDGGSTWQIQKAPTVNHLTSIFFKDALHGWITGWWGTLLYTENGGVDWHLAVNATCNNLNAVCFVDNDCGWALGTAPFIYTEDGGITWISSDSLPGNDIVFTDRQHGWLVHAGKGIYYTDDGGKVWQRQSSVRRLYRLSFVDSFHSWAMSSDSAGSDILHTSNGGDSWIHQTRLTVRPLQSIFFVDSLTGWAVGDFGVIHHTVDAGKTWELQRQGTNFEDTLFDLFFVNDSTGWAVGERGVWHTDNGGKWWQRQSCPIGQYEWLMSVHFTDANHGWAVGMMGVMLYTEDGGKHWDRSYSKDYGYWWADVYFTDRDHGWAVGLYGAIYKWTGNSLAVTNPEFEQVPKHFELQQNYPNPFSVNLSSPGTQINYSLPTSASVTIKILNILGQTVDTIVEGEKLPGNHSVAWKGYDRSGSPLPGGIYFYQVQAGKQVKVGKMTLVR
ncbi:hypothetical protein JW964_07335 [candidate division KSB1 bacterium]|nr:hypothetical protein [candidate division KSB1 bacterium]